MNNTDISLQDNALASRPKKRAQRYHSWLALAPLLLAAFAVLAWRTQASPAASQTILLPYISNDWRDAPPPQGVAASIALPDALCPNDISLNRYTKFGYIPNRQTDNVSLIRAGQFVGNLDLGKGPVYTASDPLSPLTYVSTLHNNIQILEGQNPVAEIDSFHEASRVLVNTTSGYTYVNDLGEVITILRGTERIMDLHPPDFDGFPVTWIVASDFDRRTGKTYFPSWERGVLTVVDGLQVIDQFSFAGEGASDIAIDGERGFAYITNYLADKEKGWSNNISVVDLNTKLITQHFTAKRSRAVALDPLTGYAYVTNPRQHSVTVLLGTQVVATYPVGENPWDVTVDPATGHAFVGNADDHSVTVLKDGQLLQTIALPEGKGYNTWRIEIDPDTHDVYVLDRTSKIERDRYGRDIEVCKEPWVHILR